VNKADIITAVAGATGLSKVQSGKAIDAAIDAMQGALAGGEKVVLAGFGSFHTTERAGRTGTHPKTGKKIQIASKRVVKFKSGKQLAEAVGG